MHERTQRRVCRTAFVLACAVPTFCTMAWILYFHRPWQERDWQSSLENALHVRARVNEVSASRPLQRELYTLRLADLQSAEPLLDVDVLKIRSRQSYQAKNSIIHTAQLGELAQSVGVWLAGENFEPAMFRVEQLVLLAPDSKRCELKHVHVESRTTSSAKRQIVIQAEAGENADRILFTIERDTSGKVNSTLDTGKTILPAWLLTKVLPGASRWSAASFTGVLQLEKSLSGNSGNFRGKVASIDIESWTGTDQLQTLATLQFEKLSWKSGRLDAVQGWLESSSGQVSHTFLKSIQKSLFCVIPAPSSADDDENALIDFDKIACRFRLDESGLTVTGTCTDPNTDAQGCLILADGKPLAMQPTYSNLPLANFVQVLFPLQRDMIPATREANEMGEKLPLPGAETKKR